MFALIYVWCKRNPMEKVMFYFGIVVKSAYFPFILIAFHIITGDSITSDIIGLVVGQSYIFLKDILPVSRGKYYLKTPRFL
jgi:Derlin-2/3